MTIRHLFGTRAIHAGQEPDPTTGAVMQPIYATSTYVQSSPGVHKGYEYGRTHNPTRMAFERCVADLENGVQGFAFASGLAASATILDTLDTGSHVIALDDLYGGSYRLFENVRKRSAGLEFTFMDMTDPAKIEAAIKPNTKMIWVESPSNPLLKLVDLSAVAATAKKHKLISVADNTFATPYVQRPLDHGFDLVVHSVTKYLNGHSDMVGGMVVAREKGELAERLTYLHNAVGSILGSFRFLPRHARSENAASENGAPLRKRAGDCRVAGDASEGGEGFLSRSRFSPAARAREDSDAGFRRHGHACSQR